MSFKAQSGAREVSRTGTHVFGKLFAGAPLGGAEDEAKEAAAALRHARRQLWTDRLIQPHWFLAGAPPAPLSQAAMQGTLGDDCKVDTPVLEMLTNLDGFDVRAFRHRCCPKTHVVPLDERMKIMCQAIITIASKSLPDPEQNPREYKLCTNRVSGLLEGFQNGVGKLASEFRRCDGISSEMPLEIDALLVEHINEDIITWTNALHSDASSLVYPYIATPPTSEACLGSLRPPQWARLMPFLESGMMSVWLRQIEADATSPRERSIGSVGRGIGGSKREQATAARSRNKKRKKAKST